MTASRDSWPGFTAYFDESGTHGDFPALAIGGCLASREAWESFRPEWDRALSEFSIEFFHATDFECRHAQFKNWPNEKRIALQTRLIDIMKASTQIIITAGTHKADYERYRRSEWDKSAYYYTLTQAVYGVEKWADKMGYYGKIDYVFSQGADNRELNRLREDIQNNAALAKRLRLGSFLVEDMRSASPLQAADIIAYETFKELDNYILPDQELRKRRKSMELILTNSEIYDGYFYADRFAEASSRSV